jgi:Berberine and berberine like
MEADQGRRKATYGTDKKCLAAIKKKYDRANFFCANQNIEPAA